MRHGDRVNCGVVEPNTLFSAVHVAVRQIEITRVRASAVPGTLAGIGEGCKQVRAAAINSPTQTLALPLAVRRRIAPIHASDGDVGLADRIVLVAPTRRVGRKTGVERASTGLPRAAHCRIEERLILGVFYLRAIDAVDAG